MRALGAKGGRSRRGVEQLPADQRDTVRAELRKIDPISVRAGVEEALAGGSATARIQAVRLLSDLEVYKAEDVCPTCAARAAEAERARPKFERMVAQVCVDVVVRLLTTGKPRTSDPMLVGRVLTLIDQSDGLTNPLVDKGQSIAPLVARLRDERSVEEEIERRVAEQTAGLER